mmetsp:Transcript_47564/g.124657  ORF Transcript_47564/g.124657 Transcript_47564/m.124657 type:complete len:638 (-) Transcript_47564:229-2142(-)
MIEVMSPNDVAEGLSEELDRLRTYYQSAEAVDHAARTSSFAVVRTRTMRVLARVTGVMATGGAPSRQTRTDSELLGEAVACLHRIMMVHVILAHDSYVAESVKLLQRLHRVDSRGSRAPSRAAVASTDGARAESMCEPTCKLTSAATNAATGEATSAATSEATGAATEMNQGKQQKRFSASAASAAQSAASAASAVRTSVASAVRTSLSTLSGSLGFGHGRIRPASAVGLRWREVSRELGRPPVGRAPIEDEWLTQRLREATQHGQSRAELSKDEWEEHSGLAAVVHAHSYVHVDERYLWIPDLLEKSAWALLGTAGGRSGRAESPDGLVARPSSSWSPRSKFGGGEASVRRPRLHPYPGAWLKLAYEAPWLTEQPVQASSMSVPYQLKVAGIERSVQQFGLALHTRESYEVVKQVDKQRGECLMAVSRKGVPSAKALPSHTVEAGTSASGSSINEEDCVQADLSRNDAIRRCNALIDKVRPPIEVEQLGIALFDAATPRDANPARHGGCYSSCCCAFLPMRVRRWVSIRGCLTEEPPAAMLGDHVELARNKQRGDNAELTRVRKRDEAHKRASLTKRRSQGCSLTPSDGSSRGLTTLPQAPPLPKPLESAELELHSLAGVRAMETHEASQRTTGAL